MTRIDDLQAAFNAAVAQTRPDGGLALRRAPVAAEELIRAFPDLLAVARAAQSVSDHFERARKVPVSWDEEQRRLATLLAALAALNREPA
jgi:hypothetical protein